MLEATIKVRNPLGLHARAAAQLVRIASGFRSKILIFRADTQVFADAKSILSLLTLAAAMGTVLLINVEGEDSEAALASVVDLFNSGFGEI